MKIKKEFLTDSGYVKVLPNFDEEGKVIYLTIRAGSGKVHINKDEVTGLIEILTHLSFKE